MKKTIIEIGLGVVIVALAIFLYSSVMEPVNFDNEFTKRRDACAEKLKSIRTLEEAYKTTYHVYTGSFDTLFNRLMNEDSLLIVAKVVNKEAISRDGADSIFSDLTELEKVKKGYLVLTQTYVNPIKHLREEGKFTLSDEEIRNLRYVPYPKGEKLQFKLEAGVRNSNGLTVPVVECSVGLDELMKDCDRQLVVNKKDEIVKAGHFAGWKFGSLDEAITDGNFE
ncbi:MAG: hypothetical protein MJZ51_00995 [Bacteroidales bacterium]|nr:hypothetical protein [Bacteroidales bacterium]